MLLNVSVIFFSLCILCVHRLESGLKSMHVEQIIKVSNNYKVRLMFVYTMNKTIVIFYCNTVAQWNVPGQTYTVVV